MSRRTIIRKPAIPEPYADVGSLQKALQAAKEAVEVLQGVRGDGRYSAVSWDDLVGLGLIQEQDIPVKIGVKR